MSYYKILSKEKTLPCKEEVLLGIIKGYVQEAHDYLEIKRPYWEQARLLYRDPKRDVFSNIHRGLDFFSVVSMYMATDRAEDNVVEFTPVDKSPSSRDFSRFLTNNWMDDFTNGGYEEVENQMKLNSYLTGMGALYFNGWDHQKILPTVVAVPTENILMDPVGGKNPQNHRFIGFAMRYSLSAMASNKKSFFPDAVMDFLENRQRTQDSYSEETEESLRRASGFNAAPDTSADAPYKKKTKTPSTSYVDCYDIFVTYEDCRYLITADQGLSTIFRCDRLRPISPSERKNVAKIEYPVVFRQFMHVYENDPIGYSPYELVAHNQIQKSTITNLAIDRVSKNLTTGILVKTGKLSAGELAYSKDEVTEVDVPDGEELDSVAKVKPSIPTPLQEIHSLIQMFEKQIADTTGINDISLGNQSDSDTLGEVQIRSRNLNVRNQSRLKESIDARKEMARQWFRSYQRHFSRSDSQKKTLSMQVGEVQFSYTLTPRDFNTDIPSVIVTSNTLQRPQNQEKIQNLYAVLNSVAALGDTDAFARIQREILRLSGSVDEEQLDQFVPKNPLLHIIEQENMALSAGKDGIELELAPDADVLTRLKHQSNIPTKAGQKRYADLLQRVQELGLEQQMAQQSRGIEKEVSVADGTENRIDKEPAQEQVAL